MNIRAERPVLHLSLVIACTASQTVSPPAALSPTIAPPLPIEPLDDSVQNKAHPGVHQQPEVNPEWMMASRRRQVWHQDKEVKHIAHNDGQKLLEEFTEHAIVVHRKT